MNEDEKKKDYGDARWSWLLGREDRWGVEIVEWRGCGEGFHHIKGKKEKENTGKKRRKKRRKKRMLGGKML